MKILDKIRDYFQRPQITTIIAGTGISSHAQPNDYGNGSKFPGGKSRSLSINIHDHFTLRQDARDAMYDSMDARSLVESTVDSVVDNGLRLKPVPDSDTLGITPERAEQWAEYVAGAFHLWAKTKKSHRPRINNFYQNQRLYQLFQQRDNDIFVRFYYGRDKDIFNPLQIDFLDPNQIRGYDYTSSYMQTPGNDGIIRDDAGREIGYKIWYFDQSGKLVDKVIPAIGEKSGRIFMLHGFNPEYAGQGRGYSRMTHLIQAFEDLTTFKTSIIQKAINQASVWAVTENEQQDASQPMEGKVAGPIKQYGSLPTPAADASNVTETLPVVSWDAMPEATITVPGSVLMGNLRRGDKLKYLQDTSPSASYDSFVNSFFSSICASTGMSMEVVLKKFSNNYSASRATLILCWRVANIWRDEMAADFLDPVYEMWLSEEIAAGRVSAPGWSDYRLRAAWLNCEWAGSPMVNIDPSQTAEADRLYLELGAQTLDDVARNYNGSSGKANRAKNARQFLELPPSPFTPTQNTNPKPEEKEEEDEDNA